MKHLKFLKIFFLTLLMCLTFASGAWAAEGDPVKIDRVKLKLESQLTKTGEVKVTNMGKGYTVTGCEVINGTDIDNWNSSYCARVQIGLVADSGYEFRKKGSSYFDLKGSDVYRYVSREYDGTSEVWLYVDMIPMNKRIGVPLDPAWSGSGTAKWAAAYKASSYSVTLYENGRKKKSETLKGCTRDFSSEMKEGALYSFMVTAINSDGKRARPSRDREWSILEPGLSPRMEKVIPDRPSPVPGSRRMGTGEMWRYVTSARGFSYCEDQWEGDQAGIQVPVR